MTLVLSAFAMSAHAALDLRANEQPLPVTRDPQAIAKIPPGYRFVEPGTLTVAISALNSPPLALLASDNRTRIGSDPDIARLLAGSLGLKLRLVPTAWEDWPLGIASGRYDVALINIAVTEKRKEKFDFATYRVDSLAFSVKSTSDIAAVNGPADLAGRKVIVGSGTNQERILLGWNEDNRAAGRPQAQPVYLTDDASGNLYIQSGRADIFFGPQSVAAYKAALNGQTRVVGLGPKKRGWRQPPKKATVWSMPCRRLSTGRLPAVNISRCWRVGGAGRSGGAVVGQPAGDNLLTPSGMVCRVGERQISAYT